jgi:hypothetical protein
MKFLLSFLLAGMLFVSGYSQISFFSISTTFTINHWGQSGPYGISSYHFAFDTTINGQVHHKFDDWEATHGPTYLRESNDSIFSYSPVCNSDLLLYNFGLQPGDTFLLYYGSPCIYPEWFVADTVSTVTLLTGLTVPYIHLSNGFRELRWVYHVGDIKYGFFERYLVEGFDEFVCASDSSGTLWLSNYPNVAVLCDSLTSIRANPTNEITVSTFPNPAFGSVTFQWQPSSYFDQLFLKTCTGEIVRSVEFTGSQVEIDVSQLSAGFYFYSLKNSDNQSVSGKLVIRK